MVEIDNSYQTELTTILVRKIVVSAYRNKTHPLHAALVEILIAAMKEYRKP